MAKKDVLLIVEGQSQEPRLFRQVFKEYRLDAGYTAKSKYDQATAQCDEDYYKPKEAVSKACLMERITLSEKERAESISKDAFESVAAMRAHYKL